MKIVSGNTSNDLYSDLVVYEKKNEAVWLIREYMQSGCIDRQYCCSNCEYESGIVNPYKWEYCPICGYHMSYKGGDKE